MRSSGMRDMLPADMERFRRIEHAFRDVCLGWGYREVRTPTIEQLHLFTSAGTLSPQMLDRVYSFLDWDGWSGERVVLRPDSTIPTVRLYAEQHGGGRARPSLFYVQNVLRFEQGDAQREDWQCGVELIGDTYPRGDVELLLLARRDAASGSALRSGQALAPRHRARAPRRGGLSPSGPARRSTTGCSTATSRPWTRSRRKLPRQRLRPQPALVDAGEGPAYIPNLQTSSSPTSRKSPAPLAELAPSPRCSPSMGVRAPRSRRSSSAASSTTPAPSSAFIRRIAARRRRPLRRSRRARRRPARAGFRLRA